ncbi:MAG: hypothetical protein N4A72_13325 [Bacteroidales bacterium]|jgi:hypothetical protein|nr:hypothetical protein [Bacteroidales bacterium]
MKRLLPAIIFASFVISFFLYKVNETGRLISEVCKEYPDIDVNSDIEVCVKSIYVPTHIGAYRDSPHGAFIVTYKNIKYSLTTKFDSEERFTLDSVLESGDSIIKRVNCTKVRVKKNGGKIYVFMLDTLVD